MAIESTRFLSALAPRVYEGNDPSEKLGCLKHSANLFALGRSITVRVVREGVVTEYKNVQQSWLVRALKIAAIATVILPLLAYLSATLYAKMNPHAEPPKEIALVPLSSLSIGPHPEVEGLIIDDLTDIETRLGDFPNLKSVSINNPSITDVSFLGNCPHLTTLDLKGCDQLTDFSFLRDLPQLKTLDLSSCRQLTDFSFLRGCQQLTTLNLSWCTQITNVSFLRDLPHLKTLDLSWCTQITNVSFLRGCQQLKELDLSGCRQITDFSFLRDCQQLKALNLSWCTQITDVSFLRGCQQLTTLNLSWCSQLKDFSFLRDYPQLTIIR
jgi:hypothetical protein